MVMVAPFILPVAVAGGLGLLALSPCAQSIEDKNIPAMVKIRHRPIVSFFIVIIVSLLINFLRIIKLMIYRKAMQKKDQLLTGH
jgi:hypothetical protein